MFEIMSDFDPSEIIEFLKRKDIGIAGVEDNSYYVCLECLKVCPLNKKSSNSNSKER
jgi:epoxyqueuosine reductase QueG